MLGAPGSGKGTQGDILESKTKYKKYVMSDLIKKELKKDSLIQEKIRKGILLEDQDIFRVFKKNFKGKKDIILDGVPRTEDQAYWLYGFLVKHDYDIKVVFLDVDEKRLVKRITARRYCPKCHSGYNVLTKRPKVEGICDFDKGRLIQREDDTSKVFKSRLKTYDSVRDIILKVYNAEVIKVDGDLAIEDVSDDMFLKLNIK